MGNFRASANPVGSAQGAGGGSSGSRQNPLLSVPGQFGNTPAERLANAQTLGNMSPEGNILYQGASVTGKQKLLDLFSDKYRREGDDANKMFQIAPQGAFTQREADTWIDRAVNAYNPPTAPTGVRMGGNAAGGGNNPPQTAPGPPPPP